MSAAAHAGQMTVDAIAVVIALWLSHRLGFFRGFRRARESDAATVTLLARMDAGAVPLRAPHEPYRTPKTPLHFPIVHDDHEHDG